MPADSVASDKLQELSNVFAADYEKFQKGNASAGTRARKTLQDIKKHCSETRTEIQAAKNAE